MFSANDKLKTLLQKALKHIGHQRLLIRNPKSQTLVLIYSLKLSKTSGGSQWLTNRNSARTLCVPVHLNLTANIVVRHVRVQERQLN
jgi:hypothetical protein